MHDIILLTTKQASDLLGISCDGVKKRVSRGIYLATYVPGKGKGGKQLRIALSSLPQTAQDLYNGVQTEKPALDFDMKRLTEKQRTKLEQKVFAINEYQTFKKEYLKRDYRKAFIEYFKEEYPEINANIKINEGKLEDWIKKYRKKGIAGLTDGRGGSTKGTTSLTQEMQDDFLSLYLTDKEPPITTCYAALKIYYEEKGLTIPHISSFKRFAYSIPPAAISMYRKGKKHFNDNHIASIPTVYERNMQSNDEWVADHHIYDVMVNGNGKIGRAWLSIWFDRHSRAVVGYVINLCEPNADIVLDSFVDAVTKHGIPKRVHIDNGKDYKAHDLFNCENPESLVSVLDVAVRHAIPYNAKAKSVERLFRTLEDLNKLLDSYIGNSPDNRPESMKGLNKDIAPKCISYEDFKKYAEAVIKEYNNTPHSGRGMNGRTPKEVYEADLVTVRRIEPEALEMIMRRTTNAVKVNKNGVKFRELQDVWYNSETLQELAFGEKVYARYKTTDVSKIHIYNDETGEFICVVGFYGEYDYGEDEAVSASTIREYGRHNRAVKEQAKKYKPKKIIDVQSVITSHASGLDDIDISNKPTNIQLDSKKRQELQNIKQAESLLSNVKSNNSKTIAFFDEDEEMDMFLNLGKKA